MTAEHLLAELGDPRCYPHPVAAVQLVQTHLSVVCLAGDRVYKLKKARTLPFVDFAPLAARRAACRAEVALNRRLCPTVYLGTVALRRTAAGLRFASLGDDDGPDDLDVAVVMQRLPAERMLDVLVKNGTATPAELAALAHHVAAFHARAAHGAAERAAGAPERLQQFAAANFTELAALPDHGLDQHLLAATATASAAAFARILPALQRRAAQGRVVDSHGDLHCRNICLTKPPAIYDCIEFAPAFRCGDVATENAFLVMDLRYRGAPGLAATYLTAYAIASGDGGQPALMPTLAAYRAMVRAKVAAMAAGEAELPPADRADARRSARHHLQLAAALLLENQGPCWWVVCGPPGSGKTTFAAALAARTGWRHLATDTIRKELAGLPPTGHGGPEHYTAEFTARTYAELLARATAATAAGERGVILDGNFPSAAERTAAVAAATPAGAALRWCWLDVDQATAVARAGARHAAGGATSDADAAIAAARFAAFTPLAEPVCRLDGTHPVDDQLDAALGRALPSAPARNGS